MNYDETLSTNPNSSELSPLHGARLSSQITPNDSTQHLPEKLTSTLDLLPEPIWLSNANLELIDGNLAIRKLATSTRPPIIETAFSWLNFVDPVDRKAVHEAFRSGIEEPSQFTLECKLLFNGLSHSHQLRVVRLNSENYDSKLWPTLWMISAVNIHDRKEQSETILLQEQRVAMALRAAATATWEVNLATRQVLRSTNHDTLYGYPEHPGFDPILDVEVSNLWLQRIHEDDRPIVLEKISIALTTLTDYIAEYRVIWPDNSLHWLYARGQVVRDSNQNPIRYAGVTIDITERKITEQALEKSRLVLQSQSDLAAYLSKSLRFESRLRSIGEAAVPLIANFCAIDLFQEESLPGHCAAFKCTSDHLSHTFQNSMSRFPIQLRARILTKPVRATLFSKLNSDTITVPSNPDLKVIVDESELDLLRSQGMHSVVCVPLQGSRRLFGQISFALTDSARTWTEADIVCFEEFAVRAASGLDNAELYLEAEFANLAKDEFLATLSHELRTPINVILGWSELLEREPKGSHLHTQGLVAIHRNAQFQAQLIDDLLDISKIISGKTTLDRKTTDLNVLLKSWLNATHPLIEASQHVLELKSDISEAICWVDQAKIQQIFSNLLSNAIKFSPKGTSIQISLENRKETYAVAFRDRGKGITLEFLPQVFDRFKQEDSSISRHHGGLGIGLSIVRHLIELHGGWVEAQSPGPGKGSTFTVFIPKATHVAKTQAKA